MADNIVSDSDSNSGERAHEDPINPIVEARANLAITEKAKIAKERKKI